MIESIDVINEKYNSCSDDLYLYLRETFFKNNHTKYRKYFEEWYHNLIPIQLFYFEKQRKNIIEEANIQH